MILVVHPVFIRPRCRCDLICANKRTSLAFAVVALDSASATRLQSVFQGIDEVIVRHCGVLSAIAEAVTINSVRIFIVILLSAYKNPLCFDERGQLGH
jgi:hypothetical protein